MTVDGAVLRYHERKIGRIDHVSKTTGNVGIEHVLVVAEEYAITDQGPVTLTGDDYVYVPELDSLDALGVRQLLEAVREAAAVLEWRTES